MLHKDRFRKGRPGLSGSSSRLRPSDSAKALSDLTTGSDSASTTPAETKTAEQLVGVEE